MDLRICFALACLLGTTFSAPVAQQNYARNFIPDRYDIRGDLINDDGTFSRQDPPEESEQSFFDQLNNEQNSNLAYQQPQEYQSQYGGQYGQQAYSNFQEPSGQEQQTAFYNSEQKPQQDESNDMPLPASQSDDISRDESEQKSGYYSQQPEQQQLEQQQPEQQYQNFNMDQPPPVETQQQGYFDFQQQQQQQQQQSYPQQYGYQPQAQETDDMQGTARDQPSRDQEQGNDDSKDDLSNDKANEGDDVSKKDEILRARIRKFEIPRNLKRKDLEGMLGFGKQIYLRGGH